MIKGWGLQIGYNEQNMFCVFFCWIPADCYSPQFDDKSNEQLDAEWPAPNNISEPEARQTCRAIVLNTSFIGQSCFDKLGDGDLTTDILKSCVADVKVCLADLEVDSLVVRQLRLLLDFSVGVL